MPTAGSAASVTNPLYPGGMSYDRQPVFSKGLSNVALQRNMMLDYLNKKGKIHKGQAPAEFFRDLALTMESTGLRKYGLFTDIIATNYNDRARMEFRHDLRYDAIEVPKLNDDIQSQPGSTIRNKNMTDAEMKALKVLDNVNDLFLTGAGALSTVDGQPQQEVFGIYATLEAATSGNYGMIARSGNTFLNNSDVDLDYGGTFASTPLAALEQFNLDSSVEEDGKFTSPRIVFTSLAGLKIARSCYLTYLKIEAGASGVNPMETPRVGHMPEAQADVAGMKFFYENSLGATTKKMYAISPETWEVYLCGSEYVKKRRFDHPYRVRESEIVVYTFGGQLVCTKLRANGFGDWS